MTLIMNNLAISVSAFALIFSLLVAFLRCRAEMIDCENRKEAFEKRRKELLDSRFDRINGR